MINKNIFNVMKYSFLCILRNTRRNLLSIIVIALGCASMIIFGGFVASIYEGLKESLIHSQLGHIQIFKKGYNQYHNVDSSNYLIDKSLSKKIETILNGNNNIVAFAKRFHFIGLISNGHITGNFSGIGFQPDKEFELTTSIYIKEGMELAEEEVDGVLLGEGLAKAIDAKIGDRLTILASTLDGGMNALDITIQGIFTTGITDLDDRLIRMNLSYVQNLIDTDRVTKYVLLLKNTSMAKSVKNTLEQLAFSMGLELEIKTWDELSDYFYQIVNFFNGIFNFIKLIVMLIIFISILSSMLMNIFERVNEIGVLRSMGATKIDILIQHLLEAVIIGILGSIIGIILGLFFAVEITNAAITMPRPPGSSIDYPIRILSNFQLILESFLICFLSVVVSSIYPAIKASKLSIINALRHF